MSQMWRTQSRKGRLAARSDESFIVGPIAWRVVMWADWLSDRLMGAGGFHEGER